MKISKVTPARLCISDEKCVCVEVRRKPSPSHHQLVTKNLQTGGIVNVYDILYETRKCMAFCFELGDKAILPFTDGKDVKFEELSSRQKVTEETFNDTFLFQWGEAGSTDWRSLKSVAQPSMYLFFKSNENKVTIKPFKMTQFKIDKKVLTRTSLERYCTPYKLKMTTQRVSFVSLDSNHGPSFCEATVLSTKSACRHKRKTMKIKAFKCSRTKGP
ncbi:hypothetical protein R3I94_002732 [Phoxinus phoxinus]